MKLTAYCAVVGAAMLGAQAAVTCYPDRWVHVRNDLMTDGKLKHFEDVVARGAACGFNGILFDVGIGGEGVDADGWSGKRLKRLEVARDFCREAGMEIVPMLWSVGRANAFVRSDPTLAEGQPVKSVPYMAAVGCAEFDASGAETMRGIFGGTAVIDAMGTRSKAVSLKVKPYRRYRVTARVVRYGFRNWSGAGANKVPVRTSFVFSAQPVKNGKGRNARQNFLGRIFEDGAQNVMFEFLSTDAEEERISVGVNYRADAGRLEFADVDVVEVGLRRPVVRQGCTFSVRNAATGKEYVAGKDFILPASDASPCAEGDVDVAIALPPGSAIKPGTALLVDAYEPSRRNAEQVSACMANPGLYEYFDRTAPVIDRLFGHPKKWFLSMDEIRAGGSCGACKSSGMDMAHLLAQCLARQRDSIRKVRPDAIIYAWCDMYDPCVNAIPLKSGYAMCDGDYAHSGFLAPKDIVAVVWGGEKSAPKSLEHFVSNGVPTLYATYYDVFSAENSRIRDAAAIANGAPGCRGLVYTTWIEGGRYDMLEKFGEVMKTESKPRR